MKVILTQRTVWRCQVQGQYVPQRKNRKTEIKNVDLTWMLRYKIYSFEPLAQSVEHLTFNQVVVGSTPTRLTKKRGAAVNAAAPFYYLYGHIA